MKPFPALFKFASVVASVLYSLSTHAALTAVDLDGNAVNGHEGVYDDVLDITWLADANLAVSETFGVSGISENGTLSGGMHWDTAENFIAAMNDHNEGVGYLGINTWRQSRVSPLNGQSYDMTETHDGSTDWGWQISAPPNAYNINVQSSGFTGSELAYHYYNNFNGIGSCRGEGELRSCIPRYLWGFRNRFYEALFTNIKDSLYYTGTEVTDAELPYYSNHVFTFGTQNGWQGPNSKNSGAFVWPVAPGNVAANAVPVPAAVWLFGSGLIGLISIRKFNKEV